MNLTDALAKAAANGWSDDSRWTPSSVAHQMSTERDGFLVSVTVQVTGKIKWNVLSLSDKTRSQRGTVTTLDAALDACDHSITTVTGTLF